MRALALAIAAGILMASGCCAPCATSCGPDGCGSPCGPDTLLPHLVERTRCASGCGDVYLGEWYADPPHCDPCDQCGNHVGPVACCKPWLQQLWGTRYEGGCCVDGCADCAGHHDVHYSDGMTYDGYDTYQGPVEQIQSPTPAPSQPSAAPTQPGPSGGGSASPPPPMPVLPPDDSDLYRDKAPALPQPAQPAQPLDGNPRGPSTTRAYHPHQVYQAQRSSSPFRRSRRR